MSMRQLIRQFLCSTLLALTVASCRTPVPDQASDARESCEPTTGLNDMCRPKHVLALTLEDLRKHGASLLLTCDFWEVVDTAYEEKCRAATLAAAHDIANRFPEELEPIAIERLVFKKEGMCIDTFISGREGADCFDYLQVSLPLDWKKR